VTALDFGRWQEWPSGLAAGCLARSREDGGGRSLAEDDAFHLLSSLSKDAHEASMNSINNTKA